jgi:hypothetical protein
MLIFKKLTIAVGATLVWGLSAPAVQVPAGTYANSFSGTAALYDVSGSYYEDLSGITTECAMNMAANGKFTIQGTGTIAGYGGYDMSGSIPITGSGTVTSSKGTTRVNLTLKLKGTVTYAGIPIKVTENVKSNFEIEPGNERMMGTMSGSVSVSAQGRSRTQRIPPTATYLDLPAGESGSWNITLNLAPARTKYSGTGTIVLARGRSFPVTASGTYAAKSDTSRLLIKGQQAMNLAIVAGFQNAQLQVQALKGKALGQSPHTP